MKKIKCLAFYLTLLNLMSSTTLFAQCDSFYRTYYYGKDTWGYDVVEIEDSSYIITGKIKLPFPSLQQPYALHLNNCGDTIWTNFYISNQQGEIRNCEKYNSDKVIVYSALMDTITNGNSSYCLLDIDSGYLCCLNSFITATNSGHFEKVKQMPSGKYFCTINPFLDPLHSMNVVDGNLNYLYNAVMPGPYTMNPIEDHDGNFYVCSATEQFPYYIVAKYDSMLNQMWYLNTGTANSGSPFWGYSTLGIQFSNDSNLLIVSDGPDWQLMKVNRFTGDTMWTKFYPDTTNVNAPWQPLTFLTKTTTGKYVALGYWGLELFFLDDNGNIINQIPIFPGAFTISNLEPTLEGGVIITGTKEISGPIDMIFVTKLDSLGNTVFTSEIELGSMQKQDLNIYPNPASDVVTFEIDNLNKTGSLRCSVYNIQGIACLQFEISSSKHTIDVSALPSGLYLLKATNKNVTYSKLFMVNH